MIMKKILISLPLIFPAVAFAAPLSSFKDFMQFLTQMINDALIPFIFTLAVVVFFWGVAIYIKNADDTAKRSEGRMYMLYGVIGLFVMVAVWGLVGILANTFQVPLSVPSSPFSS